MSIEDFGNYVVVITGASTGLGRALALETARRRQKLQQTSAIARSFG